MQIGFWQQCAQEQWSLTTGISHVDSNWHGTFCFLFPPLVMRSLQLMFIGRALAFPATGRSFATRPKHPSILLFFLAAACCCSVLNANSFVTILTGQSCCQLIRCCAAVSVKPICRSEFSINNGFACLLSNARSILIILNSTCTTALKATGLLSCL